MNDLQFLAVAASPNDPYVPNTQRVPVDASTSDQHAFHVQLNQLNARRLTPALPGILADEPLRVTDLERAELKFVERERAEVSERAAGAPVEPLAFLKWLERLRETGPGQRDDDLFPFLAHNADLADMCWYLKQEAAGEAGFEDLVALTQVRFPTRSKLEMARNYWDEMGRGHERGMHGPLLTRLTARLGVTSVLEDTVWQPLALANLMVALAFHRRYAYQSIGALGAIELTSPARSSLVNDGLTRLGLDAHHRTYFALHAGLDVKHSHAWNREVIVPLIKDNPAIATAIAEGALMRLNSGARCFERYRQHFGIRSLRRAPDQGGVAAAASR